MNDQNDLLRKVEENAEKLELVYKSVEKMRKYFLWTLIAGAVGFILPLIGLAILLPILFSTYSSLLS